jgi:8-oxo-dGTP pyrophosphatase MutT (NUDIX family)
MPRLAQDPPVSEAQRRLMWAAASGHAKTDVPESVAKEFTSSDPGGKLPERKPSKDNKLATDFTKEHFKLLRWLLNRFFNEEEQESEHQEPKTPIESEQPEQELGAEPEQLEQGPENESESGMEPEPEPIQDDDEPVQAAGIMFVTPSGNALFLRRSNTGDHEGEWAFPGGEFAEGENAEQAARREEEEELGDCYADELEACDKRHTAGVDFTTFRANIKRRFKPSLDEEHTEYKWAPLMDPPNPVHPGVRETLRAIRESENEQPGWDDEKFEKKHPRDKGGTFATKRNIAPRSKYVERREVEPEPAEVHVERGAKRESTSESEGFGHPRTKHAGEEHTQSTEHEADDGPLAEGAAKAAITLRRSGQDDDELTSAGAAKAARTLHQRGLDEPADPSGKLSERTKESISYVGSPKREDMPEHVFLEPKERKYPYKEKNKEGEWRPTRNLLLAAARRARLENNEALAKRADNIRAREFPDNEEGKDNLVTAPNAGIPAASSTKYGGKKAVSRENEKPDEWERGSVPGKDTPSKNSRSFDKKRAYDSTYEVLALDRGSKRSYDSDGRLHIDANPITKANTCKYVGREIPKYEELGLDADKEYKLYRDPKALEEAVANFGSGIPILSRHIPVSADKPEKDLVVGAVSNPKWKPPYILADLVFWDKNAIDGIESGDKQELSMAYGYTPLLESGVDPSGDSYSIRMVDIVPNHLATVPAGRVGSDVKVMDESIVVTQMWVAIERAIMAL